MENAMKIVEIIFKISVIGFMFITIQRMNLLREFYKTLWDLLEAQTRYINNLEKKIKLIEEKQEEFEKKKTKKKAKKDMEIKHE